MVKPVEPLVKAYGWKQSRLSITGADADKYDVYYRVHAQNIGWLGWAQNGESAGTAGYGYRLEAIQIQLKQRTETSPVEAGEVAFTVKTSRIQ
ncbi:hypothetical protein [Acetobacterium sp.]|uniref:hypothetical protein n=1 Tax=Acetobacterium sp. TaxID=1872094 RepID=UPI0035935A44